MTAAMRAPVEVGHVRIDLPDEDVTVFHDDHCSRPDAQPLFMVLTEAQSERLNGRIHTPGNYVLTGKVSLGSLRREIQEALSHPSVSVRQTAVDRNSAVGANS